MRRARRANSAASATHHAARRHSQRRRLDRQTPHERLGLTAPIGLLDISFYRDDFGKRGLHPQVKPTSIPFSVEGRALILVDDVLYTGRTTRAAINELFDYGRPGNVRLAVLADRGGRQLPIYAEFCAWQVELADSQELVLEPDANGRLQWRCVDHA